MKRRESAKRTTFLQEYRVSVGFIGDSHGIPVATSAANVPGGLTLGGFLAHGTKRLAVLQHKNT